MGVSGLCVADSRDPEGEKGMHKDPTGKEKAHTHNYRVLKTWGGGFVFTLLFFRQKSL